MGGWVETLLLMTRLLGPGNRVLRKLSNLSRTRDSEAFFEGLLFCLSVFCINFLLFLLWSAGFLFVVIFPFRFLPGGTHGGR